MADYDAPRSRRKSKRKLIVQYAPRIFLIAVLALVVILLTRLLDNEKADRRFSQKMLKLINKTLEVCRASKTPKFGLYCGPNEKGDRLKSEDDFPKVTFVQVQLLNVSDAMIRQFQNVDRVWLYGPGHFDRPGKVYLDSLGFVTQLKKLQVLRINKVDLGGAVLPQIASKEIVDVRICCNLSGISENALKSAVKLTTLHIDAGNYIEKLSPQLFKHNRDLATIEIIKNNLTNIEGVFNRLEALGSLNLSGNKLETITNDTFRWNSNLRTLKLSNNKIESIASHAFYAMKNLVFLALENNMLTSLSLTLNLQSKAVVGSTIYLIDNDLEVVDLSNSNHLSLVSLTMSFDVTKQISLPIDTAGKIIADEWKFAFPAIFIKENLVNCPFAPGTTNTKWKQVISTNYPNVTCMAYNTKFTIDFPLSE